MQIVNTYDSMNIVTDIVYYYRFIECLIDQKYIYTGIYIDEYKYDDYRSVFSLSVIGLRPNGRGIQTGYKLTVHIPY